MNSHRPALRPRRAGVAQAGFTLVEILVGLVIAMIGVAIMMEVLLTSDQRARSTSSGNEALSSGAVMLHLMQRDLVQAGFGINSQRLLGCNLELPNGVVIPLAPVAINPRDPLATANLLLPAGDANTDTLLAIYGSDNGQPEGQEVSSTSGNSFRVRAPSAFNIPVAGELPGDAVLALPGSCAAALKMVRVTAINALEVTVSAMDAAVLPTVQTILYNLGRQPRVVAYMVRNGSLLSCDFMQSDCRVYNAATWTAVSGNIVSLRAQYGRDTLPAPPAAMDGVVDAWEHDTPPALIDPSPAVRSCGWVRIPAVRFVVVARGDQKETELNTATRKRECEPVTATPRLWAGSTGGASPAPIDLSAASDWQCYRYRTFETVAPSRNVVWMRQAGC